MPAPDLTARALNALREAGWPRSPLRIEVDKRIPVAAGLGGGSADAAGVLRLAADAFEPEELAAIAASLGADVPSQIDPRFALVGGAGEQVTPLPEPSPASSSCSRTGRGCRPPRPTPKPTGSESPARRTSWPRRGDVGGATPAGASP